jgi:hypothetical protein
VEPTTYSSLHHGVAFLERRVCMEWMQHYRLGSDLELALAEHCKSLTVEYTRHQGTSTSVKIHLESISGHFEWSDWFLLQRAGNRQYIDATDTLNQ